jgi:hypothetical protein
MINYKRNIPFSVSMFCSLQVPIKEKSEKRFLKIEHWRISKKVKYLISIVIIAVLLISIFAFFPRNSVIEANVIQQSTEDQTNQTNQTNSPPASTTEPQAPEKESQTDYVGEVLKSIYWNPEGYKDPGLIRSTYTINSTTWMQVAANAWAYFTPDVGVDPNTGLPYASASRFRYFTDWDLGSYVQAVITAQEIGLIDVNGTWGSYERFDKVLTFLEDRPLNEYGYPFQFYDATTGREYLPDSNASTKIADIGDTGKLFVALNNLRNFNSTFAPRVNSIVLSGRSNYTALVPNVLNHLYKKDVYHYYVYSGFASFWPQQLEAVPSVILSNILNAQNLTTYGVSLPNATICNEPLLSSLFELNNGDNLELLGLLTQVYFACEAFYNSTGEFMAPSEGTNGGEWLYEWIVAPNGEPWRITDVLGNYREDLYSIVRNKVAISFLAIYGTDFARNMVVWLEDALPNPANGYFEGTDNYGIYMPSPGDIGNALILEAALYALQKG